MTDDDPKPPAAPPVKRRREDRLRLYASPEYVAALARLSMNLIRIRERRKLSQAQAAERCGLDVVHYGDLERRRYNATLLTLSRIASGFGVDLGELLRKPRPKY